ncbi:MULTISPECIES: glycoside hydrolase family 43 protein [Amycolatopsis]|uniref:Glycoside hydrolase 43 family protein n=1 Tax=Amycolatopsis bullii TaxID=941987 RepID=A0ABQ3KKQ5_9PSEU|nr:glycoside hydrolase family 43 protein [Amycolatopsis bullii]GHG31877.1 glycoside hydrolase 43 family protein [Amycolatopsis bullii]
MTVPIVPGFHPDPSICRVGDTYYLANSSFEYVPGVPIRRSTDLVSWELIGHALTRPGQLPPSEGAANTGIFAPTLRHHDGRFHLITTNILEGRGHLIVTAADPAGPWSDPVHVPGTDGIDPDLCWDDAGVCHLTWASFRPDLPGIASVPIDPGTGAMLGEPRLLWNGTGMAAPEGPHLYRVDGWWYLLLAEGGTERGHAVTVARARALEGPYEPAPANPILTHRSSTHPVQNTGHADLVECADGSWAMVYLGVRPRGKTPQFHVNGRETFLAGVDWVDGWPVVAEDRYPVPPADNSFTDDFAEPHPRWVAPGAGPETFTRRARPGELVLTTGRPLLTRALDEYWTAVASLDVSRGTAAFVVRLDDRHWYGLIADGAKVAATLAIGPVVQAVTEVAAGPVVSLRIRALRPDPSGPLHEADEPDLLELSVLGEEDRVLGAFDGRYLSTEVAAGFTGRMIGVEARAGTIALREFRYRSEHRQNLSS